MEDTVSKGMSSRSELRFFGLFLKALQLCNKEPEERNAPQELIPNERENESNHELLVSKRRTLFQ